MSPPCQFYNTGFMYINLNYKITTLKSYINIQFRDIISLTGYFDPSKNGTEFRHVWMKLYDYRSTSLLKINARIYKLRLILLS